MRPLIRAKQKKKLIKKLTRLDNIHANVLHHGVNLSPHKVGRHDVHVRDAFCVLHRERRRRRHGVALMRREHLLVRLQAAIVFQNTYMLALA